MKVMAATDMMLSKASLHTRRMIYLLIAADGRDEVTTYRQSRVDEFARVVAMRFVGCGSLLSACAGSLVRVPAVLSPFGLEAKIVHRVSGLSIISLAVGQMTARAD
jgi:hypothetical protein